MMDWIQWYTIVICVFLALGCSLQQIDGEKDALLYFVLWNIFLIPIVGRVMRWW